MPRGPCLHFSFKDFVWEQQWWFSWWRWRAGQQRWLARFGGFRSYDEVTEKSQGKNWNWSVTVNPWMDAHSRKQPERLMSISSIQLWVDIDKFAHYKLWQSRGLMVITHFFIHGGWVRLLTSPKLVLYTLSATVNIITHGRVHHQTRQMDRLVNEWQ